MDVYPTQIDYVHFTLTLDVEIAGDVQVAITHPNNPPTSATVWHPAQWEGEAGPTRTGRVLLAGTDVADPGAALVVTRGSRRLWIRPTIPGTIVQLPIPTPELLTCH